MLKLHGFSRSNYYNTAKMALLEKGAEFEEVTAMPSQDDDYLQKSPMGKVPCLETEHGFLSEASVICDYLDAAVAGPPLYPKDPWQRAQAIELMKETELYLDLAVRPCFPAVYFGGSVSDEVKATAKKNLEKGLAAIARRVQMSPYLAGSAFTPADMLLFFSIPLVQGATTKLWDWDTSDALPGLAEWRAKVADRPSAKTIAEGGK